ncbi:hypothetical protein [Pseudoroseicyclus aestuarii]|uniref:Uncharacterized protein n=1 Tax=Pseudoroseicyclus aestuarii TaxID=1795041 RepID=A0A318SVG6_9RHOB|nr:hypothetical protein [Pseudoroseicyclus aestuarii]PYE85840.1 hypothetical protein DFP88_101513 [Pseudoroseicyclus aestuarii]
MTTRETTAAAETATQEDRIDLGQLVLLGVFLGAERDTALVRLPGGRLQRVAAGDRLGRAHVVSVDERGLHMVDGGRTRSLTLPQIDASLEPLPRPHERPGRRFAEAVERGRIAPQEVQRPKRRG